MTFYRAHTPPPARNHMSTTETEDAKALLELKDGGPEPKSKKPKLEDVVGDPRRVQKVTVPAVMPGMDGHATSAILQFTQNLLNAGYSYEGPVPPPSLGFVYSRPMSFFYEFIKMNARERVAEREKGRAEAAKNEAAKK